MIQLVNTKNFLNSLTKNRLNEKQVNRAVAYLRAKKLCFYDNWSGSHASILLQLESSKNEVIEALRYTLNN